ncbi:MAG: 6-bladed beta-propeller [Candidatus Aminicenantales bacterium]
MWFLFAPLFAQEIIENPDKPLAKDAGRVLELRDEWVITDESGDFYFVYPHNLQVTDDGSVFIADEKQLLKFSANGRFLKNLFKQGQGPGEIESFFSYHPDGSDFFILDGMSRRFWRTDLDGGLKENIRLVKPEYNDFIAVVADGFLFLKEVYPDPKERTGKLLEIKDRIALVDRQGKEIRDVFSFHHRQFFANNAGRAWDLFTYVVSSDKKFLYAYHGLDYLIEALDLEQNRIVQRFRRRYSKVPLIEEDRLVDFRKKFGAPKMEFESDIKELFIDGPDLWVRTSTKDKAKGSLYDVFDPEGRWIDSFYLGAGRSLLALRDSFVYTLETRDDGIFRVHKSRIIR